MSAAKVDNNAQRELQAENLNDFVACLSAGGRLKIHAEHDQVRKAERQINQFTKFPEKNRYGNAVLFSNGSIILAAELKDDCTYINASRMPCLGGEVIMAQAPMKETVLDFYRLIWQHQVNVIVCLVDLDDKEQCFPYFERKAGKHTTCRYRFRVTTVAVRAEGKNIVHYELKIENYLEKGNARSHILNVIAIVDWEPEAYFDPKVIVSAIHSADALRQIVPQTPSAESGNPPAPILVHGCSGIRRTGVFALAYIFSKQILGKKQINLIGVINRARDVRYGVLRQKNMFYLLLETIIVLITETGLLKPGSASHVQAMQIVKQMYTKFDVKSKKVSRGKSPGAKAKSDTEKRHEMSFRAARKKKTKVEVKSEEEDLEDATQTQGGTQWKDEDTKNKKKDEKSKNKEKTEKRAKKEKEEKEKTARRKKTKNVKDEKTEKKEKTDKRKGKKDKKDKK